MCVCIYISIFLTTEDAFEKFCKGLQNPVTFPDLAAASMFYLQDTEAAAPLSVRFRERQACVLRSPGGML